jgi:dipeptidyl-peptidase-4
MRSGRLSKARLKVRREIASDLATIAILRCTRHVSRIDFHHCATTGIPLAQSLRRRAGRAVSNGLKICEMMRTLRSGRLLFPLQRIKSTGKLVFLTTVLFEVCFLREPLCAQPQVFMASVEPFWIEGETRFWYRSVHRGGISRWHLVDAASGQRQPAFDHAAVAAELTALLGREIDSERLPLERLSYSQTTPTITLAGPVGTFEWNPNDRSLTRSSAGSESNGRLFLPIRRSGTSAEDTTVKVTNELVAKLELVWVDTSGNLQTYGLMDPGATRDQHTYVGHVWLFRSEDGKELGCISAASGGTNVAVNEKLTADVFVDREPPRQKRSKGSDSTDNGRSPDRTWQAFVRSDNLWIRDDTTTMEFPLTTDATQEHSFHRDAVRARAISMNYGLPDYPPETAHVSWSPDSTTILAMQTTVVPERRVHLVVTSPMDQLQPQLEYYPYLKPGDPIPVSTPRLFRIADRAEIPVATDLFHNPFSMEILRWSNDGRQVWLLYNERGHQQMRVLRIDAANGTVQAVVEESSETFIHYSSEGKFELRWLPSDQILWASERSGWNHLYRYHALTGELINQVTNGEWNVRRIESIDESTERIWFYAVGIRPDQDPYHEHFCSVRFDGTELRVLTEGDGTHAVDWSPDRAYFLDRYSRVDQPPITELRSADGRLICHLETADATELLESGKRLPRRFAAKGRDGSTDIWGIVYLPAQFDLAKSWPVIENIYAGPHDHHVPKSFRASSGHQQAIADQGFVVVQIDGMGTAWRSRAFHNVCYRNLRDAGFPDRIAWIKALHREIPQLDLDRVGVYGGSAGGQNAMAALLWHGDFYKAAVADCGCHDNRMDKLWWNEQWMGIPGSDDHYTANSNVENADRLQGDLMLVVGELDRNVDPASTFQVANRLVQSGKNFEFLVVPGAGHGACETPWASRRRTAFFVRVLGGPSELPDTVSH